MRKAILLALGFAASSLLMRRARQFGPLNAVAVAGVLEEVAKRLRDQAPPDQAGKPSPWANLTGFKRPKAKV
jgi:hypothetical protein